jgi:hypothetical protein
MSISGGTVAGLPLAVQGTLLLTPTAGVLGSKNAVGAPCILGLPDALCGGVPRRLRFCLGGIFGEVGYLRAWCGFGVQLFSGVVVAVVAGAGALGHGGGCCFGALAAIAQKDIKRMVGVQFRLGTWAMSMLGCATATPFGFWWGRLGRW